MFIFLKLGGLNMDEAKNKTPQSQLKWQKDYDNLKMTNIGMKIPIEERQKIENAAQSANLKLSTFCRKCIQYCIDNNIKLND